MTETIKMDKNTKIKWLFTLLIPAIIIALPANEVFTQPIKMFLAITVCGIMMFIFEFFDPIVPSVLMPMFYMMFNVAPANVIYSGWLGKTPMVVFGALLFVAILNKTGIMERICYWIISKTGSNFTGLVIGLYIAGFFTAFVTSANSWAIYAVFTYGVAKCIGYANGPSKQGAILVAVGSLSVMSVYGTVYSPAVAGLFQPAFEAIIPGFQFTWTSHWWNDFPQWFFPIFYMFILLKFFTPKTDIPGKEVFEEKLRELGPITKDEKKTAVIFAFILAFLLTSAFHHIDCQWAFLIAPWIFFMPGINIGDQKVLKDMNYSMLFMIVAFLGIGAVASYLQLNVMAANAMYPILAPVAGSPFGAQLIAGLIFLVCAGMNLILTPYAIYAAFTGPLAELVIQLGMNSPVFIYYVLAFAGDALILPYESVGYLLFFSMGLITLKDWFKLYSLKLVLQGLWMVLICVPWWKFVGIM